jgi:hypothetical protein
MLMRQEGASAISVMKMMLVHGSFSDVFGSVFCLSRMNLCRKRGLSASWREEVHIL